MMAQENWKERFIEQCDGRFQTLTKLNYAI